MVWNMNMIPYNAKKGQNIVKIFKNFLCQKLAVCLFAHSINIVISENKQVMAVIKGNHWQFYKNHKIQGVCHHYHLVVNYFCNSKVFLLLSMAAILVGGKTCHKQF